ncbi:energy transducer TonB [Flavicella marina]|uniref:hypothetical protein n=1 Tax=Flavicella marina TaxID=1475951 RepID=UPI001264A306|nr:hypothetical protein [Flavicella marina]
MYLRSILFTIVVWSFISCDFIEKATGISFQEKSVDTVIDYSHVDEYPVFPACKELIDSDKKNRCFVNNLYVIFSDNLLAHTFGVPDCVDETVVVKLIIDKNGTTKLLSIISSEVIKEHIPNLEVLVRGSIEKIPKLFPAIKRGIPVATVYELPIVIKLK